MTRSPLRRLAAALSVVPFLLLLFTGPAAAMGGSPKAGTAAYRSLGIWDESRGLRFDLAVWYPGGSSGSGSIMDGRRFDARHGRPLPGYYPIILLSHDVAGGRFDSGDLAASLAAQGYMVIAPTHEGDNFRDQSKTFGFADLVDRPRLLLLALEAVLDNPDLGPLADESRIGLVGVGYGAVTVFQLLGAAPDLNRLRGWCPRVEYRDILCAGWAGGQLTEAGREQAAMGREKARALLTPPLTLFAPKLVPAPPKAPEPVRPLSPTAAAAGRIAAIAEAAGEENAYAVALDFQGGPLLGTFSGNRFVHIEPPESSSPLQLVARERMPASPQAQPDAPRHPKVPRRQPKARVIRAAALLAPAGGMLFAPEDLQRIQVPLAVIEAGRDEVYPPEEHARPFVTEQSTPPRVLLLPEADHFSLLAPCDAGKTTELRCGRVPERERQSLREQRDEHLLAFFRAALGGASPPEAPGDFVVADPPLPPVPAIQEKPADAPAPPAPARRRR